ncbi:MAG TPA: methyltransferase domain-containing protein [Mobilitalea sp.]|nr:methyltransferase domain-containing protein [Mobilitalea sp.]
MNQDLLNYYNNTKSPWGILFYRMIWEQLSNIKGMKILDFGSGFGITANHLASDNEVIAIEPNSEMVEMRINDNTYEQKVGGYELLKDIASDSFDIVICHNVLEYASEREEIVREFARILKPNGLLSIIKHNHAGRIMQKVVYENNVDEALKSLDGGELSVLNFGKVNYYYNDEIVTWAENLKIVRTLGVRTFWALQQNHELKAQDDWFEKILKVEERVSEIDDFRNIAFFNHLLVRKQ